MMADYRGFAPYNFIPFYTGEVPLRYQRTRNEQGNVVDDLPAHNAHHEGALSGYVEYSIRVLSDLAVGDDLSETDKAAGQSRQFYRQCEDDGDLATLAIPGSTMRGFIRSAAEILGCVRPEAIEDKAYQFRDIASSCHASRTAYKAFLAENKDSKAKGKADNGIKAGRLYLENGRYYIQPLAAIPGINATYGKITEEELDASGAKLPAEYKRMYDEDGVESPDYHPYRCKSTILIATDPAKPRIELNLLNSAYIAGKKHHYIVSNSPIGSPIAVDEALTRRYQSDYARNCKQNASLLENVDYYALPELEGIDHAKIFYYKLDSAGKVQGLGPTPYFRIPYQYSTRHGIPMFYNRGKGIDYVQSMFGYLGDDVSGKDMGYKSRLSFQNAVITRPVSKERDLIEQRFMLLTPKGSAFDMYLEQGARRLGGNTDEEQLVTYNTTGFTLRGQKVYWKRGGVEAQDLSGVGDDLISTLEVLKAGDQTKTFKGRVYFDHLQEDELGLLLMSLQYKNATDDRSETRLLGSAKPYGYGKVEVSVTGLYTMDDKARFTQLNPAPMDRSDQVAHYKEIYIREINRRLPEGHTFETEPSIRIYEKWLESGDMSSNSGVMQTGNSAKRYVYMPIEDQPGYSGPQYGKCEPMPTAGDILGVDYTPVEIRKNMAAQSAASVSRDRTAKDGMIAVRIQSMDSKNTPPHYVIARVPGNTDHPEYKGKNIMCHQNALGASYQHELPLLHKDEELYAVVQGSGDKLQATEWYPVKPH